MQITPAAAPPRHDLTVCSSVLEQKLYVLPGSRCRTGTPLTFDKGGWRAILPGETPYFFAAGPADGGDHVIGMKAMIVETHVRSLTVGRVKIVDVDDFGVVQFVNDPEGPYIALTASRVLLG